MKGFFYQESSIPKGMQRKRSQVPKSRGNPCEACGLCRQEGLSHPKIDPFGDGKKGVLVWGAAPGENEDLTGVPFCGKVGKMFRPYFSRYGIDFEKDCVTVNSLDCRPSSDNRKPTKREIQFCYHRKRKVLDEFRPKVIFLLGEHAIDSFYRCDEYLHSFSSLPLASYRGKIIPDRKYHAWVCHSYHPSYIERGNGHLEHVFDMDFAAFASMVGKPRPSFDLGLDEISILYDDENEVIPFLQGILDRKDLFSFDYETSSYRYYEKIHEIYLVGITTEDRTCVFRYSDRIKNVLVKLLESDTPKMAQNIKHEIKASRYVIGCDVNNMVYDTMIGAHVLDESKKVTSLKVQAYINFGYPDYGLPKSVIGAKPKERNRLGEVDIRESGVYCGKDSKFTFRLAKKQQRLIESKGLGKAYDLFHEGVQAFADMELNGIRIDVPLAREMDSDWKERAAVLKDRVLSSSEAVKFEEVTGRKMEYKKKLSDKDLRQLLFDILKFKPVKETKTTYSVDAESLEKYKDRCELISHELELRRLNKWRGTYLSQLLRYEVDGFIYPSFNLHLARSFRSSADEPSFHNFPKHDEEGREVRRVLIPRDGREIWEPDYSSMEIRILACQSKDEVLIEYINAGYDPHGDEAEEIFMFKREEVSKKLFAELRQFTKNLAIFPEVYGSYYKSVARDLANTAGIPDDFFPNDSYTRRYEKWEDHIRKWEDRFWRKFKGVRAWQNRKAEEYRRMGYIEDGAWGFRRHGYLDRNKLYNFPIQGVAFHCLLWSIIQLWKAGYYGWESLLCGQIHDAMFWDGVPGEFDRVKKKVERVMTEDIREAHPWIIVPLEIGWKRGSNWLEMEKVE